MCAQTNARSDIVESTKLDILIQNVYMMYVMYEQNFKNLKQLLEYKNVHTQKLHWKNDPANKAAAK